MARILLCDDAEFMRMMLREILEEEGHQIVGESGDGNTVVEQYKELSPDMVILDITMPGDNGILACQNIIEYDPEAKIVICSAMGQQAMVINAIKSGAKDFVTKPFQEYRIKEAVSRVLAR